MTTLDPRGLEAATEVFGDSIGCPEITERAGVCHGCQRRAEQIITAYLAFTQPIVETVEELVELPAGTVVLDSHQEELVNLPEGWYCIAHNEMALPHEDIARPARVIWRPHESP